MGFGSGVPGNITATFGSDLYTSGSTSVPNLLMKYYKKLGISDSELLLLIQLFYLRTSKKNPYPSIEILSDLMTADYIKIQNDLVSLIEKNFIAIGQYYEEATDQIRNIYEFDCLFEKISELWALERMNYYQKQKELLAKREDFIEKFEMDDLSLVYKTFEREFGRLLSPMEIDVIKGWLHEDEQPADIICEALKKAVLLGKHNFKYIDSILLEWKKNNLRNLDSIRSYDENFKKRKTSTSNSDKKNDKSNQLDKNEKKDKKDKFRLLYMS